MTGQEFQQFKVIVASTPLSTIKRCPRVENKVEKFDVTKIYLERTR